MSSRARKEKLLFLLFTLSCNYLFLHVLIPSSLEYDFLWNGTISVIFVSSLELTTVARTQ